METSSILIVNSFDYVNACEFIFFDQKLRIPTIGAA